MDANYGKVWNDRYSKLDNMIYISQDKHPRRYYKDILKNYLKKYDTELIIKYPADEIGKRKTYSYNNSKTSVEYLINFERINLFNKYVIKNISSEFILCDIGCHTGLFNYLVKREYPKSKHVLVDVPIRLERGKFLLSELLSEHELKDFDFVECSEFKNMKVIPDVCSSFTALGEMTKEWFNYYMKSNVVSGSKVFFHQDRVIKDYSYGYNINILDYPHDRFNCLYFDICSMYELSFYHEPIFTFIGITKENRWGIKNEKIN